MASADSVRTHSAELKKELGLTDLVLTQILYVVGSQWVGTAAKLGRSQIVFWFLALLLFYVPLAAVIIHLNRAMPLEGGLYQWAKLGFNDFIGFLVGWNLWLYIILFMSSQGMAIAANIAYALGFNSLGANKWFILVITSALVAFLIVVTVLGLSVGKWFQNAGGVAQIIIYATLLLIPFSACAAEPCASIIRWRGHAGRFSFQPECLRQNVHGRIQGIRIRGHPGGRVRNPARAIGRSC